MSPAALRTLQRIRRETLRVHVLASHHEWPGDGTRWPRDYHDALTLARRGYWS